MKQFLVFAGESYYPAGGFKDYASAHETFAEAQAARQQCHSRYGWSHIVDLQKLQIIESQYESNPIQQLEP
jgi:hypothetical protein